MSNRVDTVHGADELNHCNLNSAPQVHIATRVRLRRKYNSGGRRFVRGASTLLGQRASRKYSLMFFFFFVRQHSQCLRMLIKLNKRYTQLAANWTGHLMQPYKRAHLGGGMSECQSPTAILHSAISNNSTNTHSSGIRATITHTHSRNYQQYQIICQRYNIAFSIISRGTQIKIESSVYGLVGRQLMHFRRIDWHQSVLCNDVASHSTRQTNFVRVTARLMVWPSGRARDGGDVFIRVFNLYSATNGTLRAPRLIGPTMRTISDQQCALRSCS